MLTHHNAAAQALEEPDDRTRVIWVADLLPTPRLTQLGR
jgi:hypothetical protein